MRNYSTLETNLKSDPTNTLKKYFSLKNEESINLSIKEALYDNDTKKLNTFLETQVYQNLIVNQFDLDVGYCNPVNYEVMSTLASRLAGFKNLNHLGLKFDTNTLDLQISTKEQIESLKEQFSKLPSLDSLSIDIKNGFTDDTQIAIISQIFSKQTQLKHFKINLENSFITRIGFVSFCKFVESLKLLKHLSVSIQKNQRIMEEKDILYLWDSINQLQELVHLEVSISECNFSNNRIILHEQNYSQMEQLMTFSLSVRNRINSESTYLINQLSYFLRYVPNLNQLSVECGDDCNLNLGLLESIDNKLDCLKLQIGKNNILSKPCQVENIFKNLVIESDSSFYVNCEYDFVSIMILNKYSEKKLDLKVSYDNQCQESMFLRAALLLLSNKPMKTVKMHFRKLIALDDILKCCCFSSVKELDIEAFSDNKNIDTISQLLNFFSNQRLENLNLKIKEIYSRLSIEVFQKFEQSLSILTVLKKVQINLDVQSLEFSPQQLQGFLLNILTNKEIELKITKIQTTYKEELDKTFLFSKLIEMIQQQRIVFIHLNYVDSFIIIERDNKSALQIQVCKQIINQFIKGMINLSSGFQEMQNCTIKLTTNEFDVVISKPHTSIELSQMQNLPLYSEDDFSKIQPYSLMNYFSQYSYVGNYFVYQGSFDQLFHFKKLHLEVASLKIQKLTEIIEQLRKVEDLSVTVCEINNKIVYALNSLQNLKKLSLQLLPKDYSYRLKFSNQFVIYNQSIRFINLSLQEGKHKYQNKRKLSMIFKRLCKRLVVV